MRGEKRGEERSRERHRRRRRAGAFDLGERGGMIRHMMLGPMGELHFEALD